MYDVGNLNFNMNNKVRRSMVFRIYAWAMSVQCFDRHYNSHQWVILIPATVIVI